MKFAEKIKGKKLISKRDCLIVCRSLTLPYCSASVHDA